MYALLAVTLATELVQLPNLKLFIKDYCDLFWYMIKSRKIHGIRDKNNIIVTNTYYIQQQQTYILIVLLQKTYTHVFLFKDFISN